MKFVRPLGVIVVFLLLTIITQVGGLIYLISILLFRSISKNFTSMWSRFLGKTVTFITLYLLFLFLIIPMAAKPMGRVQLPLFRTGNLQPATVLTFFLNRSYVRSQLRETAFSISEEIGKEFPGTTVNYLDGNFPFFNGFPLLPHLSHNDGKKLDFSFSYIDHETKAVTNKVPSIVGYGICEGPRKDEENMPEACAQKGNWQYNLLERVVPQNGKAKFDFDELRTKRLIELFAGSDAIAKVFLEPHLKARLGLSNMKIVFHGCHAVRHDDHFHVQLK